MLWTKQSGSRLLKVGYTEIMFLSTWDHPSLPGIWMCRGQDMNVMVMDVEGTDGRERGEDQVRHLIDPRYRF